MHMADALISPAVGAVMWITSASLGAYSVNRLGKEDILEGKKIPLMGVAGAFVFAAQMVNFAIPATGSSGHLSGGLLLAALLGPEAGFLVLGTVLAIQALFFADGGLLALGCNMFNMGFFTCYLAYPLIMRPILAKGPTRKNIFAASVCAALFSLPLGAFCVTLQTAASGVASIPFKVFAALMIPIHLAIGVAEGVLTALVLIFLHSAEPSLIEAKKPDPAGFKKALALLAVAAIICGGLLSRFASQKPDGLEWSIMNASDSSAETREFDGENGF